MEKVNCSWGLWLITMYTKNKSNPGIMILIKNAVMGVLKKEAIKGFPSTKYLELIRIMVNITSEMFNV